MEKEENQTIASKDRDQDSADETVKSDENLSRMECLVPCQARHERGKLAQEFGRSGSLRQNRQGRGKEKEFKNCLRYVETPCIDKVRVPQLSRPANLTSVRRVTSSSVHSC